MYRVCIDVGGTFTDCLVLDERGALGQFKASTTPADPSVGFVDALAKAALAHGVALDEFVASIDLLIHGTTLATNTLINETGARTGLLTTENFRDTTEIRRGNKNVRTSMYDVFIPPYRPIVPRHLRLGIPERVIESGEVTRPLDDEAARSRAEQLRAEGVESVAVCFLHSYANPGHEARAAAIAREVMPHAYVTTSHEVLPVWREFERFSTTVVSAYVGPVVQRYLVALEERLREHGFRGNLLLMRSSGLVETVANTIGRAVELIGSGPAAAPAGALHLASRIGLRDLLSIDMGGTSLDVCVLRNGEVPTTTESWVGDERVAIKMIDIHSAGAGGGSIAWIDSLGLLRVGPRSAGADPGPACYGRGGDQPTVTDANVVLGFVPTDFFLGGEMALDRDRAEAALRRIADPLGMSVREAAQAVFTAVNSYMADTITEVSTRRGVDVRDFALVAGGGAAAAHAAFLAELLGLETVIVPPVAATYSAFGMFAMDIGRDYARSYVSTREQLDLNRVNELYSEMEADALAAFAASGVEAGGVRLERSVEMRYAGQFHEVEVYLASGRITPDEVAEAVERFHSRHHDLYTFSMSWKGVEFLTFRLKATVPRAQLDVRSSAAATGSAADALKRHRSCLFPDGEVETAVYDGRRLGPGHELPGPAVIEEATTTVVVPLSFRCAVDPWGNYVLTRQPRPTAAEAAVAAVEGGTR